MARAKMADAAVATFDAAELKKNAALHDYECSLLIFDSAKRAYENMLAGIKLFHDFKTI